MNEQKIDLLDGEFVETVLQRMDEVPAAEIVAGDLGDQEDLVPLDAGSGDRLADVLLVVIELGRVDMAKPQIKRHGDAVAAFGAGERIGPIAEKGDAIGRLHRVSSHSQKPPSRHLNQQNP